MATKKDPKQKENQARKPVATKAMADTSGGSLADFKNKVVNTAKSVGSTAYSAFKTGEKIKMEITGANDVLRLAKNPTPANAAFVALDVAAYALPIIKAAKAPVQAIRAGEAAAMEVRASRAGAEAAVRSGQEFTQTMRLKNNAGVLNSVRGGATELFGKSVSTTGTKSIRAVEAATSQMAKTKGAEAARLSYASSAGTIKGLLAGTAAVAAENVLTSKMKDKQNTKIKKK